jgi:hypothetical protein
VAALNLPQSPQLAELALRVAPERVATDWIGDLVLQDSGAKPRDDALLRAARDQDAFEQLQAPMARLRCVDTIRGIGDPTRLRMTAWHSRFAIEVRTGPHQRRTKFYFRREARNQPQRR